MLNFLAANKTEGLTKVFIFPFRFGIRDIKQESNSTTDSKKKEEERKPIITIIIAVAATRATCRLLYLYSSEC